MMRYKIFISSVQREFAKERKALAEYVRKDAILGRFFEVVLFEEVPSQERKADGVYLAEVNDCDIYLGIFGHTYGNVDSNGVSATEREYRRATIASQIKDDRLGFNASQTAPKYHGDALDDALEARLLDALRKEPSLDQVELSKVLGVSRATVQRCFKRLLGAGKNVRVGGKRFGHWEVSG